MSDASDEHGHADESDDDIDEAERPLLDALRSAFAADDLPVGMNEASESLLGWLNIDDELSSLLSDAEAEQAVRRDGGDAGELGTREGAPVIEWRVEGSAISGLVLVDSITAVETQHSNGDTRRATLTELGRFTLDDVPSGAVRLRLTHADGRVEHTRWFVV